jgi:hypothetical protein
MNRIEAHQNEIELALCKRDYDLMESYHADILDKVEKAIKAGAMPKQIKRWAKNVTTEVDVIQRIENAARYIEAQGEPTGDKGNN